MKSMNFDNDYQIINELDKVAEVVYNRHSIYDANSDANINNKIAICSTFIHNGMGNKKFRYFEVTYEGVPGGDIDDYIQTIRYSREYTPNKFLEIFKTNKKFNDYVNTGKEVDFYPVADAYHKLYTLDLSNLSQKEAELRYEAQSKELYQNIQFYLKYHHLDDPQFIKDVKISVPEMSEKKSKSEESTRNPPIVTTANARDMSFGAAMTKINQRYAKEPKIRNPDIKEGINKILDEAALTKQKNTLK